VRNDLPLTYMPTLTEAGTCRTYVVPKLHAAGWTDDQISEQITFTDGRIVVAGNKPRRRPKSARITCYGIGAIFPLRLSKPNPKKPGDGLQQAKDYAQIHNSSGNSSSQRRLGLAPGAAFCFCSRS
jgi:type I site-specific restriction endonuclease